MQIRLACSTVKRVVVSNRNKQIQRGLDIPTLSVFRKKESNMRGCLQHDENDCGLACILTICKFLKICCKIRRNQSELPCPFYIQFSENFVRPLPYCLEL